MNAEQPATDVEQTYQELSALYHGLVMNEPSGVLVHDGDVWLFANPAAASILAAPMPEDLIGNQISDHIGHESREVFQSRIQNVLEEGTTQSWQEYRFIRCDRTHFDCEILCIPCHWQDKSAVQIILKDISDRKQEQRDLQVKRFAVEFAAESMFTISSNGQILDVNQIACDRLGYMRDELLTKKIYDVSARHDESGFLRIRDILRDRGIHTFSSQQERRDGTIIDVEVSARLTIQDNNEYICATVRDVTEKQAIERTLRVREGEMRLVTDSVPAFIAFVDANQQYRFVNKTYETHYNLSREQIIGMTVQELNGMEAYESSRPYIETALNGQDVKFEFNGIDDGRQYLMHYIPAQGTGQTGYYVIATDITEIKKAQAELAERENELRMITDSIPAFIGFVDANETYKFVNAMYESYFNLSRDEIVGMSVAELNGQEIYEEHLHWIKSALGGQEVRFEFTSRGENPKQYYINYIPNVENSVVDGYFVVALDITETKSAKAALEESKHELNRTLKQFKDLSRLAHRNRLSSMGEMASAIAHELNQPLMVITSLSHLLEIAVTDVKFDPEKIQELANTIVNQTLRAGDIIHRMHDFVSNKKLVREESDLNTIISEATKMLGPQLRDGNVRLNFELNLELPAVSVDPIQIQQVFVNLLINSAEAMDVLDKESRQITIETGTASPTRVQAVVKDSGPGIPAKTKEYLFEPFESTKDEGMGLGLAISRSLIESHQGTLELDESYKSGAAFVISLPVFEGGDA